MGTLGKRWAKTRRFIEAHVDDPAGACLIWPFARNNKGHAIVHGGVAARVMCELAHGAPPTPEHEAAHNCGNGHMGCIHPQHLRWATHQENSLDRAIHGTENRGERNGSNKLTRDQILEIRARHTSKRVDLASEYGVTPGTISNIINGHKWKWLKGEANA